MAKQAKLRAMLVLEQIAIIEPEKKFLTTPSVASSRTYSFKIRVTRGEKKRSLINVVK